MTTDISFSPSSFYNFETDSSSSHVSSSLTNHSYVLQPQQTQNLESLLVILDSWENFKELIGLLDGQMAFQKRLMIDHLHDTTNGTRDMETEGEGHNAIWQRLNHEEVTMAPNALQKEPQWTRTTSFSWTLTDPSALPISIPSTRPYPGHSRKSDQCWQGVWRIPYWDTGRPGEKFTLSCLRL